VITSNTSEFIHFIVKEGAKISRNISVDSLFNPARYLKLLFELFLVLQPLRRWTSTQYTERNFRKTAVVAKDTPAFIGNVGILV
jgi:3-hydroxyacyl-CoA dehydrogenase